MTDDDVVPYLQERCPDFEPTGPPERLPGGNLSVVWRVPGTERPLIVKYAPPYIAADPNTPLDPSRLRIEARCLEALLPGGELADVPEPTVRAPRPVDVNAEIPVLIMEDVGDVPSLDQWLQGADRRHSVQRPRPMGGGWDACSGGSTRRRSMTTASRRPSTTARCRKHASRCSTGA